MNNTLLSRRRFALCATALAAASAVPLYLKFNGKDQHSDPKQEQAVIWKGTALGSIAELRFYDIGKQQAQALAEQAMAEVARLEKIFSLYRDDSLIQQLNRDGFLNNPPADFLSVLSLCRDVYQATQGAFDPTIQPLWLMYADFFRRHPNSNAMPSEQKLQQTLNLVGFDKLHFDHRQIRFTRKGMGLSLNGIAQGYITDKIVEMLQQRGISQALVDMGEIRGLDTHRQRHWQVGIKNPHQENNVLLTVPLQNQAFATSGGYGTTLDNKGKVTHLFDPRSGAAQPLYASVSVMAENAALADACSTAFSLIPEPAIRNAARALKVKVWLVLPNGMLHIVN